MATTTTFVQCPHCAGRGVVRATFVRPSGKRSRPEAVACFRCHGTGGHLKTRTAA